MPFPVKNLRNIGIVAHVDAGKTTITEHMLYLSGGIRTIGRVDDGTTQTDWLDVERERGISVRAASTLLKWKGTSINLIDTPGHVDFSAEVERTLRVLDAAVLVLSAVEGVQAHSETIWKALRERDIPTLIFINKIDRTGADSSAVLEEIQRVLSTDILPVQGTTGEGTREPRVNTIWEDVSTLAKVYEFLAQRDEELFEQYLNAQQVTTGELQLILARLTWAGKVFPVLFGSAMNGIGVRELLDGVVDYFPEPVGDSAKPVSGVVFKIERDATMGKMAYVRLYNGKLENRDAVFNLTQGREEKVTQIRKAFGRKSEDVGRLEAGDIGIICGLSQVKIDDVLGTADAVPGKTIIAHPLLKVQVLPVNDGDYMALVAALQELTDEDPLLGMEWIKEEREIHIKIMGTIQTEVIASLLHSRFGLAVTFARPSVIYKETPTTAGEGFVSYTMPKPCWAVLRFLIEPGERGSGLVYSSKVRDEAILARYQHQVEQTLPKALEQGLYGWEVTDLKVTLIDGEHHGEHTHPLDFVVATPMGIMDGLVNTGTTLLEPILHFEISVPEDLGGRVLGDLIQLRGAFDSPVISKGVFTVQGIIPVATSLDYPIKLSSMAGGRSKMKTRFAGYQPCSLELGATTPRRGINPLERAKYILSVRNAL